MAFWEIAVPSGQRVGLHQGMIPGTKEQVPSQSCSVECGRDENDTPHTFADLDLDWGAELTVSLDSLSLKAFRIEDMVYPQKFSEEAVMALKTGRAGRK